MHDGSASYLFLAPSRCSWDVAVAVVLLGKWRRHIVMVDKLCWVRRGPGIWRDTQSDRGRLGHPSVPCRPAGPRPWSKSWALACLAGRGDLIHGHRPRPSVVIPHPWFVSTPGRSHLTIRHLPLATHHSPHRVKPLSQDSRSECVCVCVTDSQSKMRCGRYGLMVAVPWRVHR